MPRIHLKITEWTRKGTGPRQKKAHVYRIVIEDRVLCVVHVGKFADGIFVIGHKWSGLRQDFEKDPKFEIDRELIEQGFMSGGSARADEDSLSDLIQHIGHLVFYNLGANNVRFLDPSLPEDYLKQFNTPKMKAFGKLRVGGDEPDFSGALVDENTSSQVKLVDGKLKKVEPPPRETFYDDNPLFGAF